jgi:hypothetical protein
MNDIMKNVTAQFDAIFGRKPAPEPEEDSATPPHLRQLPEDEVERVVRIIRSEFAGVMPFTLRLEIEGFERDRTRWDAQRLANALRHHYGREGLAKEVEDLLSDEAER